MDTQSSGGFDSRFRFQPISSLPPPEKYVQPKISDFPSKSQSHQHAPPPRQAPPPPGNGYKKNNFINTNKQDPPSALHYRQFAQKVVFPVSFKQ